MDSEYEVDFPVTDTRMPILAYLCCFTTEKIGVSETQLKKYRRLLRAVIKKRPNLLAKDALGRTALHYATRARNELAVLFLCQAAQKIQRETYPNGVPIGQVTLL